jgi:hypothetical protein
MAVTTLRLDDVATHLGHRTWVATPATEQSAEGAGVSITITQTSAGAGPSEAQTLELDVNDDAGNLVREFTLDPTAASQSVTFFFTTTGAAGGSPRHGTYEMVIHAVRAGAGAYDVESDGSPNSPPAGFHAHTATRGWIVGTTTLGESISNISAGGGKNSPASHTSSGGDSLFVRATLGSPSNTAKALTVTFSHGSLTGATGSSTSATRDASFSGVVDNRFPAASTSVGVSITAPNSPLSGQPYTVFTSTTDDTITVDPRHTISPQAQKTTPRTDGGNQTAYVISADQCFVWGRVLNARGEAVSGMTMTQQLKNGATVVASNTTAITGADGWTPSAGVDFTDAVAAPAGNRTQEALINAPSDATGLGTGAQTLGFASAFTADKSLEIVCPTEVEDGESFTVFVTYRSRSAGVLALDAAPTVTVYQISTSTGDDQVRVATTTMTRIEATEVWTAVLATTGASGACVARVLGQFAGGGLDDFVQLHVRPRTAFDPVGLALSGVLSQR